MPSRRLEGNIGPYVLCRLPKTFSFHWNRWCSVNLDNIPWTYSPLLSLEGSNRYLESWDVHIFSNLGSRNTRHPSGQGGTHMAAVGYHKESYTTHQSSISKNYKKKKIFSGFEKHQYFYWWEGDYGPTLSGGKWWKKNWAQSLYPTMICKGLSSLYNIRYPTPFLL